ncbi:hypothetical protein ALP29_201598 [Pseudomonas syringae pv. avii]|uniref:Uncharacterized protein n=1 Tax=Pseudomonas syringae pv. avii TaxID=663959 RepID=A0A3M5V7N6_PSESX|nr:hypothetical protein ALP29_201598 [Pseudomonas syringae pv. avii]
MNHKHRYNITSNKTGKNSHRTIPDYLMLVPYDQRKPWHQKFHSLRATKTIRTHINPDFCQVSKYQFNLLLAFQYAYNFFL